MRMKKQDKSKILPRSLNEIVFRSELAYETLFRFGISLLRSLVSLWLFFTTKMSSLRDFALLNRNEVSIVISVRNSVSDGEKKLTADRCRLNAGN